MEATRQLVIRIGRESRWGYTRIQGELLKLGRKISRSTVKRILQEEGIPDATNRNDSTWHEFIDRHVESLWACDFGTQRILSVAGLRVAYFLFFMHVGSRRVYCTRSTNHPDSAWVEQQARNFCMYMQESGEAGTYMIHDRDTKFTKRFDRILLSEGLKPAKLPIRSPNLNAYCESWLGSLKRECLDHFVVFGRRHLDYLIREYVAHYKYERPHQCLANRTIVALPIVREGEVRCKTRLSGLLRHYYRTAA